MSSTEPIVVDQRIAPPSATITFDVPADLVYFRGHFPDMPVVPGVVQIKWALAFAQSRLGVAGKFAGVEALKFQTIMGPGARVTLALEHRAPQGKLHFSFESPAGRHGSGRLLLRAPQ